MAISINRSHPDERTHPVEGGAALRPEPDISDDTPLLLLMPKRLLRSRSRSAQRRAFLSQAPMRITLRPMMPSLQPAQPLIPLSPKAPRHLLEVAVVTDAARAWRLVPTAEDMVAVLVQSLLVTRVARVATLVAEEAVAPALAEPGV